ncbi:MAG: hypothetical protein Q4F07_08770 [Bacteroidales bacterium]|nr:hypothetical protein [Bacteroidales bacterium]
MAQTRTTGLSKNVLKQKNRLNNQSLPAKSKTDGSKTKTSVKKSKKRAKAPKRHKSTVPRLIVEKGTQTLELRQMEVCNKAVDSLIDEYLRIFEDEMIKHHVNHFKNTIVSKNPDSLYVSRISAYIGKYIRASDHITRIDTCISINYMDFRLFPDEEMGFLKRGSHIFVIDITSSCWDNRVYKPYNLKDYFRYTDNKTRQIKHCWSEYVFNPEYLRNLGNNNPEIYKTAKFDFSFQLPPVEIPDTTSASPHSENHIDSIPSPTPRISGTHGD